MKRLAALLDKETRQHGGAVALLFALGAAVFGLVLVGALGDDEVSVVAAHASFLVLFIPLGAILLGHRLVVNEYYGRTQLFLEALPLSRSEMLAVKLAFGLAVLEGAAFTSLGTTLLAALFRETPDARFCAILAARTALFVVAAWAFFFVMGLLGRLRLLLYAVFFIVLMLLEQETAFEFSEFGPLALVDPSALAFEREDVPVRALTEAAVLALGCFAVAFGLGTIHEGSVAEVLSRRMSQKEKVVTAILVLLLVLGVVFLDERKQREPYRFPDETVVASDTLAIEILHSPRHEDAARALLGLLDAELADLAGFLGWAELPHLRIAEHPGLDGDRFEKADVARREGLLVRASYASDTFDGAAFDAYLVAQLLDEQTDERSQFEPRAWMRDGFSRWWSKAPYPGACPPEQLLALWTARPGITAEQLRTWRLYRERHGDEAAAAVAASGFRLLTSRHGLDAVQRLVRAAFPEDVPDDVRATLREPPMRRLFEDATGEAWTDFIAAWNDDLARQRRDGECAGPLAAVPQMTAVSSVEAADGDLRHAVFDVHFDPAPPPGTVVTVLHRRLNAFDKVIPERKLRRHEILWPDGEASTRRRLPPFYSRGSRAFLAVEAELPELGTVRLLAERKLFDAPEDEG